ncbi:uncharacterized protein IL334_006911 [Kwoniella shivajii]|uniref:FAD-binding domain-containing protein n=1 Tax=Kwoniella shivajii TaxID=564305 RepID=A0ABZ1D9B5_9TREE|nr:hypothetical protein IL334_006911 [Kwoniella shivajii]
MTVDETNRSFKIVIIGGGLAGLATAHSLARAQREGRVFTSLTVTVYEQRSEESSFVKYPMHIAPDARSALQNILSPDSYADLVSRSDYGITHGGITILTPQLTRLYASQKYEGEQPQYVSRGVLKKVLEEGVDLVKGRRVVRVREVEEKVEVVFEEGGSELADFVIGADGVGSIVRSQLFPTHSQFPLLPHAVVQFKLATPLSRLSSLPDKHGNNLILGTQSSSFQIVPLAGTALPTMTPGAALNLSGQGPFAEPDNSIKDIHTALEDPKSGYIFVRMIVPSFTGWEDLTEGAWIEKAIKLLKDDVADHQIVTAFEEDIIPGTVAAWGIVSSSVGNSMPCREGRLVLIGDAMHAMPPTGGAGGATAFKDAEGLVNTLLSSTELGGTDGPLHTLLPTFYEESTARSEQYLKDALHRLEVSNQSGFQAWIHRGLLKGMDWYYPLSHWVASL